VRVEVWLYSFFNLQARQECVVNTMRTHFVPRKETGYPLYRRLVGFQCQYGQVQKTFLPLDFET
jgi:hypothetical protein